MRPMLYHPGSMIQPGICSGNAKLTCNRSNAGVSRTNALGHLNRFGAIPQLPFLLGGRMLKRCKNKFVAARQKMKLNALACIQPLFDCHVPALLNSSAFRGYSSIRRRRRYHTDHSALCRLSRTTRRGICEQTASNGLCQIHNCIQLDKPEEIESGNKQGEAQCIVIRWTRLEYVRGATVVQNYVNLQFN